MIQGGDPTGTGKGGESIWGSPLRDEFSLEHKCAIPLHSPLLVFTSVSQA
jgi:cyclophilin family peptidyl-prolyl cis-trans isomerase